MGFIIISFLQVLFSFLLLLIPSYISLWLQWVATLTPYFICCIFRLCSAVAAYDAYDKHLLEQETSEQEDYSAFDSSHA